MQYNTSETIEGLCDSVSLPLQMYDRAPRKICFLIGSTPKNIGPGSYNHQESTLRKLGGGKLFMPCSGCQCL